MLDLLKSIQGGEVVAAITALVTIANVITSLTPSTADNKALQKILDVLNMLSVNVGKNKNADRE
mgnify:CR=1 FL=1|tara:strand:+ start:2108 stop:2299 length:192 start_codon:yes stop_codon:yes gene_type:complete